MAPRIFSIFRVVIIALLAACIKGNSLNLTLGFTVLAPPEVIVQRNNPLLLNCSGYSEEGPLHISWRHQGLAVQEEYQQVLLNGSLHVEKVLYQKKYGRKDEGNYTCVLRNRVGTLLSRPIQVVVARMSRAFLSEPQPLTTYEGGHACFSCQIHAVPPAVVSWFHNGHQLPHNDSRYTLLPSGTLQIAGVSTSDAGNYHCRCTNVARQRVSSEALLTVLPKLEQFQPPVFLSTPESVWAMAKNSVILECLANSFPNAEISWKKEDGSLIEKESVMLLGNSNLYFPSIKPEDKGVYICAAKSIDPDTGQTVSEFQRIPLSVFVPPTFTSVPESHVIPPAQTSRLECTVEGSPPPSVQWLKNGEPLYINGRIKLKVGNVLVISQTVSTDSGIYQCFASNAAGVNTVAARLQVTASSNQPKPPEGLKARTVSSTSIQLSWNTAISPSGLAIQAYTVHYLPTLGGIELQTVAVNTSQVITKLRPYTSYTFYVRAYNGKSASEQSEAITQMTGEDVPITAPAITLTSLSPTTLHVQWSELPPEKTRGVIVAHRIHYRKHKQASYSVIEVPDVVKEYTITGLLPKKKYDVRVMTGTKAGFPGFLDDDWPWTVYEMPDTLTAKVPMSPIMHLTVVNTTAIQVEWSMPADNTYPVHSFHLSYRQQSRPLQGPIIIPANSTKFLLFNLAPQTLYEVLLVAKNEEGESRESVRNIITFSGDNPDVETVEVVEPPHQLEAEPTSSTSIHLVWKTPETNKNISYYTVRHHPVIANGLVNESLIHYIRSTNSEVVITDLRPFTLYEFSVRSHDVHNQQGPFSQKVECKTKEDVPSPPQDLTWTRVDANSVRLNWQPPKYPNGIITAYHILYNIHMDDTHLNKWNSKEEIGTELTSVVSDLSSNTLYYLCMKAENKAGMSPHTPIIALKIAVRQNNSRPPSQEMFDAEPQDSFLGIVVGISIGVGCIIICAIIIICRNRCCPPPPQAPVVSDGRYTMYCGNGYIPQHNGHILSNIPSRDKRSSRTDSQELDCFTPMLTHYPNGTIDRHLDTKGGYPTSICNGRMNGFPHQLLGNSHSSLGSHQSSSESTEAAEQDDGPVLKQHMRYKMSDCTMRKESWPDNGTEVDSFTVLLGEGDDGTRGDNNMQTEDTSHLKGEEGVKHGSTESARIQESSCIIKSSDSKHSLSSTNSAKAVTHSIVPPTSSSASLPPHTSFDSLAGESNHNCVPSIPPPCSQVNKSLCSMDEVPSDDDPNHSLLPFSVNAFPSPLVTPRFSQSSSTHSSMELT